MKTPLVPRLLPALLLTVATTAFAETEARKDVVVRRHVVSGAVPHTIQVRSVDSAPAEMEKVAFLGV